MNPRRGVFPEVDLDAVGIENMNGYVPELLSEGFNSRAWIIGSEVVKLSKSPVSQHKAEILLQTMELEHRVLEETLGDYMPKTQYGLAPVAGTEDKLHIVTKQPLIVGEYIKEFMAREDAETSAMEEFIELCQQVYRRRQVMPDIANVQSLFNPLANSNFLIQTEGPNAGRPELVDTNFGKIQRSRALGGVWTRRIYYGAVRAGMKLRGEL